MTAPADGTIFEFLSGVAPRAGSGAARIRDAVIRPDTDPDADAALDRFRKKHKDVIEMPRIASAVRAFRARLAQALDQKRTARDAPPFAEELPATWRDLFEKLKVSCREALGQAGQPAQPDATPETATAEMLVATVVSHYVAGADERRYGDLRDPKQLWPVLLEMTARRVKRKLTAATVNDPQFAEALGGVLEVAFEDVAKTDRQRMILALTLFGKGSKEIARTADDLPENVKDSIRSLHADLHLRLSPA